MRARRDTPKPIVCKLVRRLAKEALMTRGNDVCGVDQTNLGLPNEVSLSSVRLFDHLTPKMQHVYSKAKKFKASHGYEVLLDEKLVYLRKDGDSRAVKIIGSSSNHDDDGNKNITNLNI